MELLQTVIFGCAAVSIFDALGSILSRALKFKYSWLSFGSALIYGLVAIFTAKSNGTFTAVLAGAAVGIFDATAGLLISKKLKAYIPELKEEEISITLPTILTVALTASIVGWLSILIFG